MAEIVKDAKQTIVDYTSRDSASLLEAMRAEIPRKLPEWLEPTSEADFGNVLLELFAHLGDVLSYYQDRVANESFLGTAQSRRSVIHHLRLIGYRLATAAPAATSLELSFPATATGVVTLSRGDAFATASRRDAPAVRFEYTRDEPMPIDLDAIAPGADGRKLVNGVPVEEGRLVRDEILGTSDGSPNQRFPLAQAPLVLRSLGRGQDARRDVVLVSELGGIPTAWHLRDDLAFSRGEANDFTLEIDENDRAEIRLGDGTNGALPPAGALLRASYRVGGGPQGNVAADSITTLVEAPALQLLGARVRNPERATGGAERESLEHATGHAPEVFRSLRRAVTAQDYEALARDFAGVDKVRAVATHWNTVTLFVAPEGEGERRVSDVLEANLLAYFEDLRPLSTIVEIADVTYVPVFVTAELGVEAYFSRQEILDKVRACAGALLGSARVDFGRPIFLSKFYEEIEAIDGVAFVTVTEFRRDASPAVEPRGRIDIAEHELAVAPEDPLYLGGIQVVAIEGGVDDA